MEDLAAHIRAKIAAGTLPIPPGGAGKLWVGHGNGRQCDACDEAITAADREYEIDLSSDRTIWFHAKCLAAWHDARAKGLAHTPMATNGYGKQTARARLRDL